jgi:3-hydroxyethyl bacteriochlorophyllide a dehydrogenase
MQTIAVVLQAPEQLELSRLELSPPGEADLLVDVTYSGISTGTERLLWSGRMPPFPGMGYPLVPGYESVGVVRAAAPGSGFAAGETVFVPGANCFGSVRGLFGGAANRLVVPAQRVVKLAAAPDERGVLLALAATAYHAIDAALPDLIVGHGVLGRLIARLAVLRGRDPIVWETNPARVAGAQGYHVLHPDADCRRDYGTIIDVSGDAGLLDTLIGRVARGGEVVLAGFYSDRLSFGFPPFFMREARIRAAAEWQPSDLPATAALIASGALSLDGLITHRSHAGAADDAYRTAFGDPACLKMVLDWRDMQ